MYEKYRELLYRSFDSELSTKEQEQLEQALTDSEELRREKDNIIALRQSISMEKRKFFKPFFADRVMAKIAESKQKNNEELFFESLFALFRPVAIAATILIIIVIGYNISASGQVSVDSALAVPDLSLEEVFDPTISLIAEQEK